MSNQVDVLVMMTVLLHIILESNCQLQVYTPDDQTVAVPLISHGFDISNTTVLKFQVKACANVHVFIQRTPETDLYSVKNYAFIFGANHNSDVSIRTAIHGATLVSTSAAVLSCTVSKALWISWTNGVLKLGRGTVEYTDELLSKNVGSLSGYKYAFLLTGWGSYGCWSIDINPVPVYYRFKQIFKDKKLQASGLLSVNVKSKFKCAIKCARSEQSQCACQGFSYNNVTGECFTVAGDIASTLVNNPGWMTGYL